MDIGTAKPTKQELAMVPHHCVDLVSVDQPFNVSEYLRVAKEAVEDIASRGKNILVTGGSGFYLKGFFEPVVDDVPIPEEIESKVESLFTCDGLEGVVELLRSVSPDGIELIDLHNSRRVLPALKRCLASGLSIRELRTRVSQLDFPFRSYVKHSILLNRSAEILKNRIAERISRMLSAGLIQEVEVLLEQGLASNPSAAQSIGYREVIAYLRGQLPESRLVQEINKNTYQLVRKQNKWFRKQIQFDGIIDLDVCLPIAESLFQTYGRNS